jgi:Kdo2-lipid IVA lauroyltransferase/acyltransferase
MPLPTNLRYRLEYAGFRAIQAAIVALPLEAASRWSGSAWRLIAPRLYRQKRVLNNLALAYPEMPPDERERIASAMWDNLGRTFAEGFRIRKTMEEGRIEFESQALLDEMIRAGPCVVCGLHLGNWELVAYTGKLMGAPFTAVYQRLSNPYVDAATRKLRPPLYDGRLLPKTPVTARALLKTAKQGGYPAFLADLRDDNGAPIPFFGAAARSTVFPALLAAQLACPFTQGPRSDAPMCDSPSA